MQRRQNLLVLYTAIGGVSAVMGYWLLLLASLLAALLLVRLVSEDRACWDNLQVALEVADDHEYRRTLFQRFVAERGVVSHRRPLADRTPVAEVSDDDGDRTRVGVRHLRSVDLAAPRG